MHRGGILPVNERKRGLREGGEGLMETGDDDIGRVGEERGGLLHERKVCPVCGVHDEHRAVTVDGVRDRGGVRDHTLVGRGGQNDRADMIGRFQSAFHVLLADTAVDARCGIGRREQGNMSERAKLERVIDRFVAVARDENGVPRFGYRADRGKQTARRAVHQRKGATCVIEPCRTRGETVKDAAVLWIVQIVKARDFGDVCRIGKTVPKERGIPLVPGHMHRNGGFAVIADCRKKILFLHLRAVLSSCYFHCIIISRRCQRKAFEKYCVKVIDICR